MCGELTRRIIKQMPKDAHVDDSTLVDAAAEVPPRLQPFTPAELIACDACGRPNAPHRATCIYCGVPLISELKQTPRSKVPTLRTDPSQDSGLLLVMSETKEISDDQAARLSTLMQVEATVLKSCVSAGGPLPLLRPATVEEAGRLSADLLSAGLMVTSISESELGTTGQFRKIRGLEWGEDSMAAAPKSENDSPVPFTDVLLVVTGRVITNRVEIEEKRRRRSTTPVDSRQFIADESVLDIYARPNAAAWRIYANAFDFSCLGPAKSMTGFANFAALVNLIGERMPNVVIDDSYYRKRAVLEAVWPVEQSDKSELRLAGRGKLNFSNITTSDNESQFTKYSALAWAVRAKTLEGAR